MSRFTYCNQCGTKISDDLLAACRTCGELLPPAEPVTQPVSAIPPGSPRQGDDIRCGTSAFLVVRNGRLAGAQFWLRQGSYSVGRAEASDVFLSDITVSRRHAEIVGAEHGYFVRDLQSLNGTYANGARVDQHRLAHGDELQFGRFRLSFLVAP